MLCYKLWTSLRYGAPHWQHAAHTFSARQTRCIYIFFDVTVSAFIKTSISGITFRYISGKWLDSKHSNTWQPMCTSPGFEKWFVNFWHVVNTTLSFHGGVQPQSEILNTAKSITWLIMKSWRDSHYAVLSTSYCHCASKAIPASQECTVPYCLRLIMIRIADGWKT